MVLSIFGLLTAVVTYNYGAFNNQITLTNLAYEIAMQVREAQVYSLGVRGSNNTFDSRYGIYFKAGSGSFISFIDKEPSDGKCDVNGTDCDACTGNSTECQQIISLPRNMKIEKFLNSSDGNPITGPVFITFKRPYTEAILVDGNGDPITSGVDVIVVSPDLQYKKVTIKQNGYISVGDHTP